MDIDLKRSIDLLGHLKDDWLIQCYYSSLYMTLISSGKQRKNDGGHVYCTGPLCGRGLTSKYWWQTNIFILKYYKLNRCISNHFAFLKEKLEEKLSKVDNTLVRGEYKMAIYSRYILPSLQFHFTVHNIHQTHLDSLDNLAKKYLKLWLSLPSRGATDLGIFHPQLLGFKYPYQVYNCTWKATW